MDTTQPKTRAFVYVEQMPEFKGDVKDYINRTLVYPPQAKAARIQGMVQVKFVVNEDGSVSDVVALTGKQSLYNPQASRMEEKEFLELGYGLEDEAVRIVRSMPPWRTGKQDGMTVRVLYILPVVFKLP